MTDWLDNAKAIEELERERLIEAQRALALPSGPSRSRCLACDDDIPVRRQAWGGIVRCMPCQTLHERRGR